jgi:hypothetical protein
VIGDSPGAETLFRRCIVRLTAELAAVDGIAIVRCHGGIKSEAEIDRIARRVAAAHAGAPVVLNLGGLGELRRGFLALLWFKYLEARTSRRRIVLANVPGWVLSMLHRHHIEEYFEIYEGEEAAVALLAHGKRAYGTSERARAV